MRLDINDCLKYRALCISVAESKQQSQPTLRYSYWSMYICNFIGKFVFLLILSCNFRRKKFNKTTNSIIYIFVGSDVNISDTWVKFEILSDYFYSFRGGFDDASRHILLFLLQVAFYSVDGLEKRILLEVICYGEISQSFFQLFLHLFFIRLLHKRSAGHGYG